MRARSFFLVTVHNIEDVSTSVHVKPQHHRTPHTNSQFCCCTLLFKIPLTVPARRLVGLGLLLGAPLLPDEKEAPRQERGRVQDNGHEEEDLLCVVS